MSHGKEIMFLHFFLHMYYRFEWWRFYFVGFFCLNITTPPEINITLKSNSSIILNCTYKLDDNEVIKNVLWKKLSDEDYNDLVDVTPDGVYYSVAGLYLENRSELHRFGNGSTSVVLIIKDVRCTDNGQYQCFIKYLDKVIQKNWKNTVVYVQGII